MQTISEKLWPNMSYLTNELSAEVRERESFVDQLQAKVGLDEILGGELQRRSTQVESRNIHLQVLAGHGSPKWLQVQLHTGTFVPLQQLFFFFSCSNSERRTATCVRS